MNTDEMKLKIRELTHVEPQSDDPKYLAGRLAELRRSEPMAISMAAAAKLAVIELAAGADVTVSRLVREAIVEWAEKRKLPQAARIAASDDINSTPNRAGRKST